jgi:hypothetical protein
MKLRALHPHRPSHHRAQNDLTCAEVVREDLLVNL